MPAVVELKSIIFIFMACPAVHFGNADFEYPVEDRNMRIVMAGKTDAVIPLLPLLMSRMALRA